MSPRAVQLWVITMAASSKAAQQLLGQHVYVNVLLFSQGVWMWQLCVKRLGKSLKLPAHGQLTVASCRVPVSAAAVAVCSCSTEQHMHSDSGRPRPGDAALRLGACWLPVGKGGLSKPREAAACKRGA